MLKTKHKIMIIAVLSIVAVSLGCIAFSSGNGAAHSVMPTATPETVTVYIPMPEPTPTAVPIPLPTEAPATPIAVETKQPEERTDSRTEEPSPTRTVSDGAFTLEANGKFVEIGNGVDEVALEDSPGWLTTSAYPGEEGVCVIYGHRNRNHLRVLKDCEVGDKLSLHLPNGKVVSYLIESIEILENDGELRVPTLEGSNLMLATCYPFYYSGHAPQKYVVIGKSQ